MGYQNPVPSVEDVQKANKFTISVVFTFGQKMTREKAAKGIAHLIQEQRGEIPVEWIQFAQRPSMEHERGCVR